MKWNNNDNLESDSKFSILLPLLDHHERFLLVHCILKKKFSNSVKDALDKVWLVLQNYPDLRLGMEILWPSALASLRSIS